MIGGEMREENPYEAPAGALERPPMALVGAKRDWRPRARMLIGWAVVFAANLPIPLMFADGMTDPGGKVGMWAGVLTLLVLGGVCCDRWRRIGLAMVVGGSAVGLSQVMPGLQIIAGMFGMLAGSAVGLVTSVDGHMEEATGLAGGWFVTMVTGGLLMAAAGAIGLVLQLLTPGRWWGQGAEPDRLSEIERSRSS